MLAKPFGLVFDSGAKAEITGWNLLRDESKVFGTHHVIVRQCLYLFIHFKDRREQFLIHLWTACDGRNVAEHFDLGLCAVGVGDGVDDIVNALYQPGTDFRLEGPQSSFKNGSFRNNIGDIARLKTPYGKGGLIGRGDFPCDQFLQCKIDMHAGIDWIYAKVRC